MIRSLSTQTLPLHLGSLLVWTLACSPAISQDRPNIVLMMCDDLGWGDVGFNGGTVIDTPNLDALAKRGVVLDRFYAQAPVCSPTRASFLTGRHHDRMGVPTANAGHLPTAETTLFELARGHGYRTGHFGKWHLGTLTKTLADSNRGKKASDHFSPPWMHGVDASFVTEAKVPTFDPMWRPVSQVLKFDRDASLQKGWSPIAEDQIRTFYGTHYFEHFADEPSADVSSSKEVSPVDPSDESLLGDDSEVIMNRVIRFVEAHGNEPFLAVVWFHTPHLPVVAGHPDAAAYFEATDDPHFRNYYGCVTAMDRQVGRLCRLLEQQGTLENTLIGFCSDNGPEGNDKAPGRTGPFRGRKRSLYEGGVRVPAILSWPAALPQNVRRDAASCTVDYLPTVLDALNLSKPSELNLDGISLLPIASDAESVRGQPLGFHFRGAGAWHDQNFKCIGKRSDDSWELYDLVSDPGERNDLSAQRPQKMKAMRMAWQRWYETLETAP